MLLPVALALALTLTGAALLVGTGRLRDDPASANRALTDPDATTKVVGDVGDALSKIFSYSYTDTAATQQAARKVLAGAAYSQYEALFSQVLSQAPRQRLTLITRVVRTGVTDISGDTAHLLVFMDQVTTRSGKRIGTAAAAQLAVTARLHDGHWQIIDIKAG
jgi:Mce-associated membrane protein